MRKRWILGCIGAGFLIWNGTGTVLAEGTETVCVSSVETETSDIEETVISETAVQEPETEEQAAGEYGFFAENVSGAVQDESQAADDSAVSDTLSPGTEGEGEAAENPDMPGAGLTEDEENAENDAAPADNPVTESTVPEENSLTEEDTEKETGVSAETGDAASPEESGNMAAGEENDKEEQQISAGSAAVPVEGTTAAIKVQDTAAAAADNTQKRVFDLAGLSARLSDGVYEIRLRIDQSLAVGTNGQSLSENVGINLQKSNDTDSQRFVLVYTADGTYSINNYNSGKALSASGKSVVQSSAGGNAQRWILKDAGNGSFYLVNAATGAVLKAGADSAGGGKNLQTDTPDLSDAQQFVLVKKNPSVIANGTYSLNILKNKALFMSGAGSAAQGAQMKTAAPAAAYTESHTQNYAIKSIGNGYYQITNSQSGLVLAVNGGSTADGTAVVQQKPKAGNMNQMWIVHPEKDGTVSFINAYTGKMAMISSTAAGTGIIQKDFDNTASRQYRLQSPQIGPVCSMWFPNGVYTISSGLDGNLLLSAANGSAGGNIQINKEDESRQQRFRLTYDWTRRTYTIISEKSGLAVSPADPGMANGVNVVQESAFDAIRQHWAFRNIGGGQYQIVNQWSGKALDVYGSRKSEGTNVRNCTVSGGTNQKWDLKMVGSGARFRDGIYELNYVQNPSLSVGTQNSLMTNNANVQLQADKNTDSQRFILTYCADGTYLINNYNSGRTLSAVAGKGGNVVQHSEESGNNQRWILGGTGTGAFCFVNASTGMIIGAASSAAADGTNLIAGDPFGTKTQQFTLTYQPAPDSYAGTYIIRSSEDKNWGMHVTDGSRKVNAHVELSRISSDDANAQKFRLTPAGDGYYTITNVKSKHALGVYAGYANNGFNLHQEKAGSGGNLIQKWLVRLNSNGTFSFINAKTGKTAMSQSVSETRDMIQSDYSFTPSRQFLLQKTEGNDTAAVDNSYEPKAYEDTMIMHANRFDSPTGRLIIVDRDHFRTKVYTGSKGYWKEVRSWICSVGSPGHPTTPGEQEIRFKAIYFNSNYMRLYFASGLSTGRLFHSIGYYNQPDHTPRDPGPVYDGTLGARITGGCIRLAIENARWIYYNCPVSTKVYIY